MHVYVMTFLAGPCVLVVSNDMDMLTYSSIRVRCPYLQYTTRDILVFRWTLDRAYLIYQHYTMNRLRRHGNHSNIYIYPASLASHLEQNAIRMQSSYGVV